ncbi:hypothetical protein ACFL09_03170 [Planctomycetota bacterium]
MTWRELVAGAVECALEDLARVAGNHPHEVMPKEEQARSAMYAFLRGAAAVVHVEATYPGTRQECDLRVKPARGRREIWIELKNTWWVRGWDNSATELAWKAGVDIKKLAQAPSSTTKLFILFGYFDHEPSGSPRRVPQVIFSLRPDTPLYDSGSRDFHWGDSPIRKIRAWIWQV